MTNNDLPALSDALIKRRGFFDKLRLGTYLTSSWLCAGGAFFSAMQSWDTPGKIVVSGMSLVAAFALTGRGLLGTLEPHPLSEEEIKLNQFTQKISSILELKKPVEIQLHDNLGVRFSVLFGNRLYINKRIYASLNADEKMALILHEFPHAKHNDLRTTVIGNIAQNIGLMSVPAAAIGAGNMVLSQTTLTTAFMATAGLGVSAVLAVGSNAFSSATRRFMERRADRDSIVITHNPQASISVITKLTVHEDKNPWQKLMSVYPARSDRIRHIMEDVREAWPDHADFLLGVTPPKPAETKALPAPAAAGIGEPQMA